MDESNESSELLGPSRSQLKREDHALIELARELAKLPAIQIQQLPLTEQIVDAIHAAAALPPRSARKRQIKYIGGLMRKIDVTAVKEQLACLTSQSAHATRELHQLEQWRERLLSNDKQALTDLLDLHPTADHQYLRQLIRNAKKEQAADKPPKSSRLLFKYLRELFNLDSDLSATDL